MKKNYFFYAKSLTLALAFIVVSCNSNNGLNTLEEQTEETEETGSNENNQNEEEILQGVNLDGSWDGCIVGLYTENGNATVGNADLSEIRDFETLTGQQVGSAVWFPNWENEFPTAACNALLEQGIIPHLTWELYFPSEDGNNAAATGANGFSGFTEVLNGQHNAYIDEFARKAKALNGQILIRFLHEFNGNWYVWSGNKNGGASGGPDRVVQVWKYVVNRFRAIGADNVKWLWTPHGPSTDRSEEAWNDVANYWPGDDYVDWIGLDAYNFYPVDPWGGIRPLRDFDNCFRALYDDCAALGDHPMMIAEFGTGEYNSGDSNKAVWLTDAFSKIKTAYPRVKIYTWFNINKELDWRVNSSTASLNAYKTAMEDDYYKGVISN